MRSNSPLVIMEKMNVKVFFFLLFLFQVIFIFQGIDLSDEGFYATFYQRIYNQPETAQYNFMFWFSGIVGGAFVKVFPFLGLWGIRFAGVLVTTGTIIITYNLLKKYLDTGYLKLSLLIVVLFINNNLKELHYNDLSALLNMITIFFLFRGLKEDKMGKLFLGGLFVSLSTFTRLPNILCLGLALAIFFYGHHVKNSFKKQLNQLLVFGGGFVFMTAVILVLMKLIGHLDIFFNSIRLLSKMGSGGEESFYGPMVLIKNFVVAYTGTLKYAAFILLVSVIATLFANFVRNHPAYRKWAVDLVKYGIILLLFLLLLEGRIQRETILYFFTGLTLIITALILFTKTGIDIKLLSLMGLFILLTYPFSSSAGLFTVGIYSLWLSFPIAMDYLFSINSFDSQFTLSRTHAMDKAGFIITGPQLGEIRNYIVVVCIFGCLVYTYRYPFFDRHDRLRMTHSINNKYLKGILTTKERASAMNELLEESAKYLKPNDYMLSYQCMPMLNYITDTRPYMRNSYPWLYNAETFKAELYKSLEETKTLPVVIMQKIKTIGDSSNWPDSSPEDTSSYEKKNEKRNNYMNEFLQANHYREVWNNTIFRIWVPQTAIVN
ncbi:MAG: glycosyltransferase family 39 protein [Bacteroidota bacterium]|nr:glycosyltransferase family 39 protein [Bacteroidota bacterium]